MSIVGVGFGVAVWIQKAIPEPQNAEQQQCSPAFLLCVPNRSTKATNYMSITALLQNLSQWDLPLESSLTEKAMLCKVKGDIVGYLLANSSCSFDEQMQAQHIRTCATNEYTTLRRYAEEHNVPFDMHHLSYLKQYNRKTMEHRYSSSPFWCSIAHYLNEME